MSFTFTITCNTAEEIERLLAALRHDADPAVVAQVGAAAASAADDAPLPASGEPVEAPKRRGRPPREKASNEPAASTADDKTGGTGSPDQPTQQPEKLTLDDARGALRSLQSRIGEDDMASCIAVLKDFGATRITEVKPEDYAAFVAACEKAG